MQTIHLEIQNDLKDALLSFLKLLPQSAVKIYEEDDTTYTSDDEAAFQKALQERTNGESIKYEQLKESLR